jgi:hypothetical protein
VHGPAGLAAASAALVLAVLCSPRGAAAQPSVVPDPHAAQPERPSVATHARTVAPGWAELESGFLRQQEGALSDRIAVPVLLKIGLGSRVQLDVAPAWNRNADHARIESGLTDVILGVKWRLADAAPLLGMFAIQTSVSLPTGNSDAGLGTGSAGLNLLAISSRRFGPVSVDANVGYTRLGGDGSIAPHNSTVWAVSSGLPIAGRLAWGVEVFGYPGTSGPAGSPPVVGLLTGPAFTVRPSVVVDAGAIFDLEGFGGTAVYGGLTWNIGRAWRSSRQPPHQPSR